MTLTESFHKTESLYLNRVFEKWLSTVSIYITSPPRGVYIRHLDLLFSIVKHVL